MKKMRQLQGNKCGVIFQVARSGVRQYARYTMQISTAANDENFQTRHCRTLPIVSTMTSISGYPAKLKIYLTNASRFWQVRCFFKGRVVTQSTRSTDKRMAVRRAGVFYEQLVANYYVANYENNPRNIDERNLFETVAEQAISAEYARVVRGELSAMTFKNTCSRIRQHLVPLFGRRSVGDITFDDINKFVNFLTQAGRKPVSIGQYLQSLRLVLAYAYAGNLIDRIPAFPKIRKTTVPRGGFTVIEYRQLVVAARRLAKIGTPDKKVTHRSRAGGVYTRTNDIPTEMAWLIGFMVNGFMRPSDVAQVQHRHVEVVRGEHVYLRLTLPETKLHRAQIVTLQPAVRIYEKLKQYMAKRDLAKPEDYLFLPEIRKRDKAGRMISVHFDKVLDATGLRLGPLGQRRTVYSLRHTSIMYRLLYGRGIDLLTLARNARTSVEMIEKFYASNLTAEMNIGLLQSGRNPQFKKK